MDFLKKHSLAVILVVYFLLALFFFLPLKVPAKLAFPLIFLALSSLVLRSWWLTGAFFFSSVGDFMGTQGIFLAQMGGFALAHAAFIGYFFSCRKPKPQGISFWGLLVFCIILLGAAMLFVVPSVPAGILRGGVVGYCLLIDSMLFLALSQRNPMLALGALLFVLSDSVLAVNKFVCHIPKAWLFIIIPYYLAQILLFAGAFRRMKTAGRERASRISGQTL